MQRLNGRLSGARTDNLLYLHNDNLAYSIEQYAYVSVFSMYGLISKFAINDAITCKTKKPSKGSEKVSSKLYRSNVTVYCN